MPRSSWQRINERIGVCRQKRTQAEIIEGLRGLYEETDDGMVAFALGEEMETAGDIDAAETYYKEAEQRFPLPAFKKRAMDALTRLSARAVNPPTRIHRPIAPKSMGSVSHIKIQLLDHDPGSTLFLASCTKKKIWDISPGAPDFVPARYAYIGDTFLNFMRWASENQLERRGFIWMVLSGKYGFIEPWHPIGYYDIPIDDEACFPVTRDYLNNQVKQVRWRRTPERRWAGYNLGQFDLIVPVNCGFQYIERIRQCFAGKEVMVLSIQDEK